MKATTQVEAIPEPMEMLAQERKGHEFTPNALTVPTAEVAAEKTKEHSAPKDLEPTCKPAQQPNKGNTALVTTITTTKVAATSNAAATTTTAADTNSDKRAAIVPVITTHKRAKPATNSAPITNLGKRADTVHAKKAATKLTKKVVISSVPTTNHAKKEAIVHVTTTRKAAISNAAATSNARTTTITIVVAISNAADISNAAATNKAVTNNVAAISNAAVISKATIANARPTTIQMQNTA